MKIRLSFNFHQIFTSFILLSCALVSTQVMAMPNASSAKRALIPIYYEIDQQLGETNTLYCGCPISYESSKKWSINIADCGYKVRKNQKRANRLEMVMVMPAWEFGHQMKCWQEGGRKNCKRDNLFSLMEGDLHNLYPSIGEINGDRRNFQFSDWNAKPGMYGKCDMVVDFDFDLAQPPKASRGQIARAYLYMSQRYDIKLSDQQRRLYEVWDRQYAPDEFECLRNELITEKQGNDNPFITEKCAAKSKHTSNNSISQNLDDSDQSEAKARLYEMLNDM